MAKILIIDDDESIREFIKKVLTQKGHEIIEASDGNIGLELFDSHDIDLVITDVIMEHSGLNVIKNINDKKNEVPIMVITGSLLSAAILQDEYSVSFTLVKPFKKEALWEAVQKLLP